MTMRRQQVEESGPELRNAPMRHRAWLELVQHDDVASIESDAGALVLAMQDGQLNLHYAFGELETMRLELGPLFEQLKGEIGSFDANYVRIDLIQLVNRDWVQPLLRGIDFEEFAEWMDMVHPKLDPDAPPPEFSQGVTMRRGEADDADRIVEIEAAAYGDLADGEVATRERLATAAWVGVLESDGAPIAYAINGEVERAEGRIHSAAVHPDAWGEGLGRQILAAASYQLVASEARSAVVRVRPDIPQALQVTQALGFTPGPRGVEWRRTVDEQAIEERRARARISGVKARFGGWR